MTTVTGFTVGATGDNLDFNVAAFGGGLTDPGDILTSRSRAARRAMASTLVLPVRPSRLVSFVSSLTRSRITLTQQLLLKRW